MESRMLGGAVADAWRAVHEAQASGVAWDDLGPLKPAARRFSYNSWAQASVDWAQSDDGYSSDGWECGYCQAEYQTIEQADACEKRCIEKAAVALPPAAPPAAASRAAASVLHVCLTGGPCGGKTTAFADLQEHFRAQGTIVLAVPEVASMLFTNGCQIKELFSFQLHLMQLQMALEAAFHANVGARRDVGEPQQIVVLHDRGICDVAAYVPHVMWPQLLAEIGMTQQQAFSRYDLVIHIQSAARGAEEVYVAKRPVDQYHLTLVQAQQLDLRTLEAWADHARRVVVDNLGGGIGQKLHRVRNEIANAIRDQLVDRVERSSSRNEGEEVAVGMKEKK